MSLQDTGVETDVDDASFEAILNYDWDADEEFQVGIQPIIASAETSKRAAELMLQAKCFFYARNSNIPISYELFKQYVARKTNSTPEIVPEKLYSPPKPLGGPRALQISSQDPPLTPSNLLPSPPPPTPMTPNTALLPSPPPPTPITPKNPAPESSPIDKTPYPTSFAHIVELIMTGQPIPGIKEIPNKLSEQKPSESVKSIRKKPWEANTIPGESS